jgi:hypothetical protein
MSRTAKLLIIALAIAAVAPVAHATVGGDSWIEVLGYDEADAKIYLLETRHDAAADLPQLVYLALGSDEPTRMIRVRSWYEDEDAYNQFPGRLRELRQRLVPLEAAGLTGLEIDTRVVKVAPCNDFEMWGRDCRDVRYEIRLDGRGATLETRTWGFGDVTGVWKVPGQDWLLGLFRHRGHTHESGYDLDEVVILAQ